MHSQKHNSLAHGCDVGYAKGMNYNDLIFRIHSVVRAIEADTALDNLNLAAREILKFIGQRSAEGLQTRSSDVIVMTRLGTAPTIYARLSELEDADWIKS